jgi:hypothetical protein
VRAIHFILLSAACAATTTFSEAVARFPLSHPEVPLSTQDTIVGLSIREALLHGVPDFAPAPQVVIEYRRDVVSSHALPPIDSVSFFLLDSVQIRKLGDRVGTFRYLRPFAPQIRGDTALLGIATGVGFRRTRYAIGLLAGGACSWRAVRRSGAWVVDTVLGCIIS